MCWWGAGTVLTPDQVDQAVDGGASFVVSPGFNPRVVDYCLGRGIPIVPGVSSPTHIELGLERGLSLFKFFPAEALGGLKLLTAMAAPYTGVRFMPTGGINIDNMRNYLASPMVVACGGTWMVKSDLIRDGKFDEITRLTREANAIVAAMPRETTA
jgi:2-dehydro-3-deoxyphosphogluconate aldolase/(4S)-4-hydroxy-2-oxoglutarate aldolase